MLLITETEDYFSDDTAVLLFADRDLPIGVSVSLYGNPVLLPPKVLFTDSDLSTCA